jgi:hypothetical protein
MSSSNKEEEEEEEHKLSNTQQFDHNYPKKPTTPPKNQTVSNADVIPQTLQM